MRMRVNSRILLVEDDPTIVKTLTEFLKLEGFFRLKYCRSDRCHCFFRRA